MRNTKWRVYCEHLNESFAMDHELLSPILHPVIHNLEKYREM